MKTKSAMGYSNHDPEMGVMTLAMMKKAQHKPMMSEMPRNTKKIIGKKGKRNRKIHGKGESDGE